jgi:serine/threonine-protein kinase
MTTVMQGRAAQERGARYETILRLSAGGMGTVYVGTARGALGFRQIVAIKKPHPHLLHDPSFRASFVKEARLASLLHHANVVDVRDVEATDDEVFLVMGYVEGASLSELIHVTAHGGPEIPPGIAVRIVLDACAGLHAAHELTDERGRPLNLVHRDISPQNLIVGLDGLTRVADFGIAKFNRTTGTDTTAGHLKGKLSYTAPECLQGAPIDRRIDVFAMGVVLFELLTGTRLFRGQHDAETMRRIVEYTPPPLSMMVPAVGSALDDVLETALAKSREARFDNILAMASALETSARAAGLVAGHREVAEVVQAAVGSDIEERRRLIRARLASEPSVASAQIDPVTAAVLRNPLPPATSMTRSVDRHPWESTIREARIEVRDGETASLVTLENATVDRATLEPATLEHVTREQVTLEHAPVARRDPIPMTTLRSQPPLTGPDEPDLPDVVPLRRPWLPIAGLVVLLCVAGSAVAFLRKGGNAANAPGREPAAASAPAPSPPPSIEAVQPRPSAAPPPPPASSPSTEKPAAPPGATHGAASVASPRKRTAPGIAPPRSAPAITKAAPTESAPSTKPAPAETATATDPPPNPYTPAP